MRRLGAITAPCRMATAHPPALPTFPVPTTCIGSSRTRQRAANDSRRRLHVTFKILVPALLAVVAFAAPVFAADYQAGLGPMPLDDETKAVIAGRGDATATSDGKTLTVKGNFHGMPSNATEAHIFVSPVAGMPGKQI